MSGSQSFSDADFENKSMVILTNSLSTIASVLPKNPIGIDDKTNLRLKEDNKCFVCKKKFGLGKKHYCRFCGNSVCTNHSYKKKQKDFDESLRICDNCDLEIVKQEIRAEIQGELSKLQDSIDIAKESYEKVEIEKTQKAEIVKKLHEEIENTEKIQKSIEEENSKKLDEEIARGTKASETVDQIKRSLNESHESERELNEKCAKNEEDVENIKVEIMKIKEKKSELLAQLDHISNKLKGSLPLEQVLPNLCERCKTRVSEQKSMTNDSGMVYDDDTESYISTGSYTKKL